MTTRSRAAQTNASNQEEIHDQKQEPNEQSFTFRDFAHAFAQRWGSTIYCVAHAGSLFLVPSLGLNWMQNGAYYLWYMYPSMTHVMGIGAFYASPLEGPKLTLGSILGRMFVSTLFATSVVLIGGVATGRIQNPMINDFGTAVGRLVPSFVSTAVDFIADGLSDQSRQFIKFNSLTSLSYVACFISLGYYFRAIPDFFRDQYVKLVESAKSIAKQRAQQESKKQTN